MSDGDVTVWQVVSKPADLMMWIRIPTKSAWLELDLKQFFKKWDNGMRQGLRSLVVLAAPHSSTLDAKHHE